jgi:hypothetical protein
VSAPRWIAIVVLAISPAAHADSPDDADTDTDTDTAAKPETKPETKPADSVPADAPAPPGEYDPIIDEARIDSLYQRVDELYARAEELLARSTPPAPQR